MLVRSRARSPPSKRSTSKRVQFNARKPRYTTADAIAPNIPPQRAAATSNAASLTDFTVVPLAVPRSAMSPSAVPPWVVSVSAECQPMEVYLRRAPRPAGYPQPPAPRTAWRHGAAGAPCPIRGGALPHRAERTVVDLGDLAGDHVPGVAGGALAGDLAERGAAGRVVE